MEIIPIKTPIFKEKENLLDFLLKNLPKLKDGDIAAITSKIISLAQGRAVGGTAKVKEDIIKKESKKILKTPWCFLTFKNGEWCVNAGVDESNANGKFILLPKNLDDTCRLIRKKFKRRDNLKKIGVLVTDTRSLPMRAGIIGRALAYCGFEGLKNYAGRKDIFGKKLKFTQSNVADALAAAAVLVMGEGNEKTPVAVIRSAGVKFINKKIKERLFIRPENDLYKKVYTSR